MERPVGTSRIIVAALLLVLSPVLYSTEAEPLDEAAGQVARIGEDLEKALLDGRLELSLIVQFDDGPDDKDREALEGSGWTVMRTFHVVPGFSVKGPVPLLEALLDVPGVVYIENNDQVVLDMEMGTNVINATVVWESVIDGPGRYDPPIDGKGVTVCAVDTGIDAGHPDLDYGTKTIMNVYDTGAGVWVEMENTDVNYGHGTHVAGTVAGNGDASAGARRGVAPGANLIGVTIANTESAQTPTEDGYIQGLEWVYDHSRPGANPNNIRVVTNSWHSTVQEYDPDSMLTQVIEKLTFENNVVSTWSAGNDGRDDPEGDELTTSGQGNTPIAVMVAAYERDGSAVTDFSSRGRVGANHTYPDVGAPGRSIWSTSARRTVISAGTYTGGNTNPYYLAISGTSMSTPHVAGLVALLWQAAPSMRVSELHEDYSGQDSAGWYGNPKTRIHEAEWILEASARFLPPTVENGNVAGDTNSTGWGGRPIDYVQGYGLVDARKAVGIALTLERLRKMYPGPSSISVWDAIEVYEGQDVATMTSVKARTAVVQWSGEYSRYNDQAMNPLSLVNQTKYVEVPEDALTATITLTYSGIDLTQFSAGDLAFTIDFDGDGTIDHQSSLSLTDNGMDTAEIDVTSAGTWTFGMIGRGLKLPRPLQGTNYVELRMEYDMSVVLVLDQNGTSSARKMNAVYAPAMPGEEVDEGFEMVLYQYDLRDIHLPEEEVEERPEERPFPWGIVLIAIMVIGAAVGGYYYFKKRRPRDGKKA